MTDPTTRQIRVPVLARVEGEGALDLTIEHDRITQLALRIFEPPRFFEQLLCDRHFEEVPDIVARICGICPVAYQMSAVHALEKLFGIDPGPWVRNMRRVFYCGEWIESHSLHIHLLALPDFLGYPHAIAMAKDFPEQVRRGLRLQATGNALIRLLGARSVHPVGTRVGGFYSSPAPTEVAATLTLLDQAREDAQALLSWTNTLNVPTTARDLIYVSLHHGDEYPMNEGDLIISDGHHLAIDQFEHHFAETQVPYSTALHCLYHGQPYLVGPLARLNHNIDRLHEPVREALAQCAVTFPSQNPYHSLVARAAEIYYAVIESQRLLHTFNTTTHPFVPVTPRAGTAIGCTEAPRGTLWHRYDMDEQGMVRAARIIPPTSQNQAQIESDLRAGLTAFGLNQADEVLRQRAEQMIRNYDPCISCATHFLSLNVTRN